MAESFLYKDMLKAAEWSRDLRYTLPAWSRHYAEANELSRLILAKVQRAKLLRGIPLDTPLTPHPNVRMPDPDGAEPA